MTKDEIRQHGTHAIVVTVIGDTAVFTCATCSGKPVVAKVKVYSKKDPGK